MHKAATLLAATLFASASSAEVTFQYIADGYIGLGVSNGGAVVTGNSVTDQTYETFRWTEAGGIERLGRATNPVLGTGAGGPEISADGTRISATILNTAGTLMVPGVWEDGVWWECLPTAPDGGILDLSYGSAWGISGDGQEVVGLYWLESGTIGASAHAMTSNPTIGITSLSQPGRNDSRANGANHDGTVVGGWEAEDFGNWTPTVWVNGVRTTLEPDYNDSGFWSAVQAVSGDGTVCVGGAGNATTGTVEAGRWVFDGANWNSQHLGILPGTALGVGRVWATDVSHDGDFVVGVNRFWDNGPFSITTGFIWTPETGMVDVIDWLADNGIDFNSEVEEMISLESVSPAGDAFIGVTRTIGTFDGWRTFLVRIIPDCPWDLDGDGNVGSGDLALIIGFWGQTDVPGDFNGDGVGSDDLAELIGNWGPCP